MAILKCKMCGGDIELSADKTFGTCESCGSTMTFPKVDDEQRANMFNRGNHFRRQGEFDKALAVYERIVQEDENDAEAHWCCALCRFGIEYVEDPNTFEYLPTCHRASFDSFLEDVDYLAALEHSDGITRRQYQKDAAKIAEVQRGILATSQNEEPFDVFICYKESENDGTRTRDSLMAQEIYYQLTEQGRRVFFSRITLEDKAGTEYEPYIFAALNSAKVMIVVTTSAEHVNAVWVKNEWSRFLSLMRKDRSKLLLPCYRDMDPYDLPEALSVLQSYDMGKIGFIQDLTRGVNKVLDASAPKTKETVKETVVIQQQAQSNTAPLLKRAFMFLEDGDFARADEFCEQVLNLDPENAEAYLGKLMAELRVKTRDALKDQPEPLDDRSNYKKAFRFGDEKLKAKLSEDISFIIERNKEEHQKEIERIYNNGIAQMDNGNEESAIQSFRQTKGYRNSDELEKACIDRLRAKTEKIAGYVSKTCKYLQKRICCGLEFCGGAFELKLGVQQNGTIIADQDMTAENQSIFKWKNIIAVSAGRDHYVGLKSDGTVVAAGDNLHGKCNVSGWKNIVAIAAGYNHTVGLQSNGKVVSTAPLSYMNTDYWDGIIAITAGEYYTVGLKADGTVITTKNDEIGCREKGLDIISQWTNIVDIAARDNYTVGLKADGTVVAAGKNDDNQCNVSSWTNIIAIAVGYNHTVGLRTDGTVVTTTGSNEHLYHLNAVSEWKDIVAIAAGYNCTIGIKADGSGIATGWINRDRISKWKLFNYETILKEISESEKRQNERINKRLNEAKQRKQQIEKELELVKGLFAGRKRRELEEEIRMKEKEIKELSVQLKYISERRK